MTENATRERRIEAAARAVFDAWNSDESLAFLRNVVPAEEGECVAFATAALDAADAVSEPTPRQQQNSRELVDALIRNGLSPGRAKSIVASFVEEVAPEPLTPPRDATSEIGQSVVAKDEMREADPPEDVPLGQRTAAYYAGAFNALGRILGALDDDSEEHDAFAGGLPATTDARDDWLDTDAESVDAIVDGENITLMQRLIYKLKSERDAERAHSPRLREH